MDSKKLMAVFMMLGAICLAFTPSADASDRFPYSVASGDPRPDSVVLWTKVHDPEMPAALRLEVAGDEDFSDILITRDVVAEEMYDYCVKVRVGGLAAYTTYFYRFVYGSGAMMETSPVGRTRTAPDPAADQPVRFAVIYCQDYIGRYYNALLKMLRDHDEDIDFVVHLGDYVYETTGNLAHQDPNDERKIVFEDLEGAIALGTAEAPNYAAASLANYRTLYRTYRSDPMLQQIHERWPMIVIWDDHEFSDDSWGANATYFGGMQDELDPDRRRNAEQAFFEWIPIDAGLDDEGDLAIDASNLYPNATIYRDFHFGSQLHLVMTDYRSFRPDHIVPEDAYPGTIALDQDTLVAALSEPVFEALKSNFDPYVDLASLPFPILNQTLALISANMFMMENPALGLSEAIRLAEADLKGNISVTWINTLFNAAGLPEPYDEVSTASLPRGLSYLLVGKSSKYGAGGSRYMVVKDTYELLAGVLYQATAGQAQDALGGQQMAWLQGAVSQSDANWTVLASSVMMTPLIVDFNNPTIASFLPPDFPDALRIALLLNADHYDGFPQKRMELLGVLGLANNPIVISGDIHSTFVTDHGGIFEFTGPAVSSATWQTMVGRFAASHPILGGMPGIEQLLEAIGLLHQISASDPNVSSSRIAYANTTSMGYLLVDAAEDGLTASLVQYPESEVGTSYYDDPESLDDLFLTTSWMVQDGVLMPAK